MKLKIDALPVNQLSNQFQGGGVVAKPQFDSRCGSASLCPWERHLMLFPILGQAVYPLWWPCRTKDMQTEPLLCWSGVKDTEHTSSDSNEEESTSNFKGLFKSKLNSKCVKN